MTKKNEGSRDVFIVYTFNAPRELVFKAWADPEHLQHWYAPQGCTVRFEELDIREGGQFRCCIYNPEFGECWSRGTYREIVFPERIVHDMVNTDEQGNPVNPADIGMDPEWPGETLVTVTFTEMEGKTRITLHQTVEETIAKRTGAHPSWIQMLQRFEKTLLDYH